MSVPYTDNEASEARQWSNRYGPPNAWTASFGTAARMIGRLLDERERLMADAMLRERERTNHDAAPAATAQDLGTGDTTKPISGCVSDRSKPINGPDPDSRVWETPVHTPATHATPGEGSVPREGTQEPVAWGVANGKGLLATSISRIDAVDMQSEYACDTEVVPLYRHPPCQDASQKNLTLTDAEREAVEYYIGTGGPKAVDAALRRLVKRHGGVK